MSAPPLPEPPEGGTPVPRDDGDDEWRHEPLPDWPAWTAPAALLAAFGVAIVWGVVVALVASAFGASLQHPTPAVNIVATVLQDVAFVGTVLAFARRAGPLSGAQLGLRRTPLRAALGWSALALLAFFVLSAVWAALVNIKERDQLPDDLGVHSSTVALVAVCVLVTVIAPIAEELLFRGYIFTALRTWRGPWLAALLTGLLFGAIHVLSAPVAFLAPLALLGFLLCLLRWRTGSLLPCMGVHALNNAIAFGVNEADWNAWQTILLIFGAIGTILLLVWPFVDDRIQALPAPIRDARALN